MRREALRRLLGLLRKEFLQIGRDSSALAIAFLLPSILLLLFGYGVSLDAKAVPIALVAEHPDPIAASFMGKFAHSPYFRPQRFLTLESAQKAFAAGRVEGIVLLRSDFGRKVFRGGARIGVIVNGVDANTARLVEGYVQNVAANWLEARARSEGLPSPSLIRADVRVWFNPALASRNYLVPGLMAINMTLTGALLTALVVAREWERGTMEALMATPVRMREILFTKLFPYYVLGMGGMAVSWAMAVWLFGVPFKGSLFVLFATTSLFLLATLVMGLLISSIARNQFLAAQIAIVVTFLPAFILSGFIFDLGSMPAAIRLITYLFAARYFVAILQTIFLAGDIWSVILPNAAALLAMSVLLLAAARFLARKRLD